MKEKTIEESDREQARIGMQSARFIAWNRYADVALKELLRRGEYKNRSELVTMVGAIADLMLAEQDIRRNSCMERVARITGVDALKVESE